jgi:hypothetical protein
MMSDARSNRVFQAPNLTSAFAALAIPSVAQRIDAKSRDPEE